MQRLDKIQGVWKAEWGISEDSLLLEKEVTGHLIPTPVCKKITQLVEEHKAGRLRSSDADGLFFCTFLDYPDKDKIPRHFFAEWKSAKEWFLRHAHLREKYFGQDAEVELIEHFREFI